MVLTLPTKISLLRIPLAVLFSVLVWQGRLIWALAVFLLAALSNFVNGYIAKKKGIESISGRIIDSVSDRIYIILSFIAVCFGPIQYTMSVWVLIVVFLQDFLLGLLGIKIVSKRQTVPKASIAGKIATLSQEIFVPLILLKNIMCYEFPLLPFEIMVVTTSLISGIHHLRMWILIWRSCSL